MLSLTSRYIKKVASLIDSSKSTTQKKTSKHRLTLRSFTNKVHHNTRFYDSGKKDHSTRMVDADWLEFHMYPTLVSFPFLIIAVRNSLQIQAFHRDVTLILSVDKVNNFQLIQFAAFIYHYFKRYTCLYVVVYFLFFSYYTRTRQDIVRYLISSSYC